MIREWATQIWQKGSLCLWERILAYVIENQPSIGHIIYLPSRK